VWESRLNWSWNRNKLLFLDTLRTEEFPSGASFSPGMQRNRVGHPLGAYFLRFPLRNAQGRDSIVTGTGGVLIPVYDTAFKYVGPAVPTRIASFSNTITLFKNWQIYGLLDYQGGHWLFNYKEYNRCVSNNNCKRLSDPNLSPEERAVWGTLGGTPTIVTTPMTQTLYVERADFVKLRDLSLTYRLPTRWAQRARAESMNLVVAGHNLALWTDYTGLDPEVNGYSNNVARGSGSNSQFVRVDAYANPMVRRYTVSLAATF